MKMRRFMSARESLGDARIAYTLAAALTAALIVMGALAGKRAVELESLRGQRRLETLIECADSLRCYSAAEREDDRLSAALRFANASVRLECRDSLREALADCAGSLRYGSGDFASELADKFALLAETGGDVDSELGGYFGLDADAPDIVPPETRPAGVSERYLIETAESEAKLLLGEVAGLPPILPSESGFSAVAANLKLEFSGADGRIIRLVYIRPGASIGAGLSASELRERGLSAARALGSKKAALLPDEELCGYRLVTAVDMSAGSLFRLVYDAGGRLWAFCRTGLPDGK